MQIHRVRGRDLRDALEKARAAHGDGAVVLSHEASPGGGVTVSVSGARGGTAPAPVAAETAGDPGLRDVLGRLTEAGVSAATTHAVLEAIRESGKRGAFAIDEAATALAARVTVAPSPKPTQGVRVLALVGPTGSGKTTTVVKLADRLRRAGRKIAVATLDAARPGGVDVLRAACEEAEVPFHPCRYREDLAALVAEHADVDAILLDTRGRSPRDREHLAQLSEVLRESLPGADVTTYLMLPATSSAEVLEETFSGFAVTAPDAVVVTKLDETRRTGVAVDFACSKEIPVAFLCNGQETTTDFYRATSDRLADVILGGRVR